MTGHPHVGTFSVTPSQFRISRRDTLDSYTPTGLCERRSSGSRVYTSCLAVRHLKMIGRSWRKRALRVYPSGPDKSILTEAFTRHNNRTWSCAWNRARLPPSLLSSLPPGFNLLSCIRREFLFQRRARECLEHEAQPSIGIDRQPRQTKDLVSLIVERISRHRRGLGYAERPRSWKPERGSEEISQRYCHEGFRRRFCLDKGWAERKWVGSRDSHNRV